MNNEIAAGPVTEPGSRGQGNSAGPAAPSAAEIAVTLSVLDWLAAQERHDTIPSPLLRAVEVVRQALEPGRKP